MYTSVSSNLFLKQAEKTIQNVGNGIKQLLLFSNTEPSFLNFYYGISNCQYPFRILHLIQFTVMSKDTITTSTWSMLLNEKF